MKTYRLLCCAAMLLAPSSLRAQENNTIGAFVDNQMTGAQVASDYVGLSYETAMLRPAADGSHYFSPSNEPLVRLFRTLGIRSLRLGGNSVDVAGGYLPTEADLDELFGFARAADVKVIYSVRLQDGTAAHAERMARHISSRYADRLDYFTIGNEPGYYKDYERALRPRWDSIMQAMRRAAPKARFCAPDDNPNPMLCSKLWNDYGAPSSPDAPLQLITLHSYPAGCAYQNPNTAKNHDELIPFEPRERAQYLLSDQLQREYAAIFGQMQRVVAAAPFRLSETNSYWYGGLDGASNVYASALWALDYMLWWQQRGALGTNFHTGDRVGGQPMPARYASFVTEGDGFSIFPLCYALKAFGLAAKGKSVPVRLTDNARHLSAYATTDGRGITCITFINKSFGSEAAEQHVSLTLADAADGIIWADGIVLCQQQGDIHAQSGITLGGSTVMPDGTMAEPKSQKLRIADGTVDFSVPAASAVIVKVCTGNYHIVNSQTEPMQHGSYKPTWNSLKKYEVPEWFRQAKFGIWAHWGPQSVPEYGDWYAHYMYKQHSRENKYHLEHYGHPSQVGFKDLVHQWTASRFDAQRLIRLYKRAGAQYFVTLANHHDNFDLWDSQYHPWNATAEGPQRNIVGEWEQAARQAGLRFGVSVHSSRAWNWYDVTEQADGDGAMKGVSYDGILTQADGQGQWWEGKDPQVLYARHHSLTATGYTDGEGRATAIPDSAYVENYYERTLDVINKYRPDLVYFDDSHLPLWPESDAGLKIAAHYYNSNLLWHNGRQEGVITAKQLTPAEQQCLVWDVERGALSHLHGQPWQTCTCLGSWHYDRTRFTKNTYKTAQRVIRMLADIVSKNGNLLLSVPIRADGTLDEREEAILDSIASWMKVNRECIFDTRPWEQFGEGPDAETVRPMTNGGFNEGKGIYTAEDIRFTQRGKYVYAILLQRPKDGQVLIKSFARLIHRIRRVDVLGEGAARYTCTADGLRLTLKPGAQPIPVVRLTLRQP